MTLNSRQKQFLIKKVCGEGYSLWNLYKKVKLLIVGMAFNYSKKVGIECFSSPFDSNAVELLEKLNCPI